MGVCIELRIKSALDKKFQGDNKKKEKMGLELRKIGETERRKIIVQRGKASMRDRIRSII